MYQATLNLAYSGIRFLMITLQGKSQKVWKDDEDIFTVKYGIGIKLIYMTTQKRKEQEICI